MARKLPRTKPSADVSEVLRLLAKQIFTNDRHGMDIDQLAELPEMDRIAKTTLRKWCAEDDWLGARARLLRGLRRDMEDSARRAMISAQRKQLVDANEIYESAMEQMRDELLQPKSYESVAAVAFKAQEVANAIAARLGDGVAADVAGPESVEQSVVPAEVAEMAAKDLTPDEWMSMAHAGLKARREKQLQLLAASKQVAPTQTPAPQPEKPKPPGHIVSVDAKPTGGGQ